jgi:endonuclease YncB( thermonuclease family)
MEVHMQKLIVAAIFAGAVLRSDPVLVTRVPSGDSIAVSGVGRVALLGIDAPPLARARERLESLVIRRWVRLEYDDARAKQASTHRAYVMLETGECVNTTLLREGLARVAGHGQFGRRLEFERAEEEARRFRRGIWARYTSMPDYPISRLSNDAITQLPNYPITTFRLHHP